MKHFPGVVTVLFTCGFGAAVQAQQIDFEFQLLSGDQTTIDFLQDRLIAGGEDAKQVGEKLPNIIQSRRLELVESVKIQSASGKRAVKKSSERMVEIADDWETNEGMSVEIDPVLMQGGALDININYEWLRKTGRDYRFDRQTFSTSCATNAPVLLQRISEGDEHLALVMTAATAQPGANPAPAQPAVYLEFAFYESAAAAEGKKDAAARVVFPNRSGQRAKAERVSPLFYEEGGAEQSYNIGYSIEADLVLTDSPKAVQINCNIENAERFSGTDRTANGDRIPKVTIRRALGVAATNLGETVVKAVEESSLADFADVKPSNWKATVTPLKTKAASAR